MSSAPRTGSEHTAREIAQQPALWGEVARLAAGDARLASFLAPLLGDPALRLVLTGAGTSAYIGQCLAPALTRARGCRVEPIATTDLVSSPGTWLSPRARTLLVSFARSGNSPESVAAVELAESLVPGCAHLIVTCNEAGALYRRSASMRDTHALLLPEATNDQSFAMTSSFSCMLLAAAAALRAMSADAGRIGRLGGLAREMLGRRRVAIEDLVTTRFDRAVYLGSNELMGLAREAALKMLELTDGQVVSLSDSPLGFRHGPKTVVNGKTLVVMFLSGDAHTRRYELDVLEELRRDGVAGRIVALTQAADAPAHADTHVLGGAATGDEADGSGPRADRAAAAPKRGATSRAASAADLAPAVDGAVSEGERGGVLSDLELCLPYAVFAQSLAMLRSLSLGLSPDRPNAAGVVNRVVQGVGIYPYRATR